MSLGRTMRGQLRRLQEEEKEEETKEEQQMSDNELDENEEELVPPLPPPQEANAEVELPPPNPPPNPVTFYLTPSQSNLGIIDMNSKEGKKHFYSACRALCDESFEDDFLTILKTRGYDNEWVNTIFMVPRNKDDLNSERISIIDNHGELFMEAIRAFEMSYIATPQRQA
jgi:hypothetical protein